MSNPYQSPELHPVVNGRKCHLAVLVVVVAALVVAGLHASSLPKNAISKRYGWACVNATFMSVNAMGAFVCLASGCTEEGDE